MHLKTFPVALGLAALVFAAVLGLLRTADLTATDAQTATGPLHLGRVAGAATDQGDVTLRVETGTGAQTFIVTIDTATTPYNLLRLATQQTLLTVRFDTVDEAPQITQVGDVASTPQSSWGVSINGTRLTSLDAPLITPGTTVVLSRL